MENFGGKISVRACVSICPCVYVFALCVPVFAPVLYVASKGVDMIVEFAGTV